MIEVRSGINDDYAFMSTTVGNKELFFYYGYERVWSPEHGFRSVNDIDEDDDSANTEWVFYVQDDENAILYEKTAPQLGLHDMHYDPGEVLLHGIGFYMSAHCE